MAYEVTVLDTASILVQHSDVTHYATSPRGHLQVGTRVDNDLFGDQFPTGFFVPGEQYIVRVRGENRFGKGFGPWSNFTDPAHGNGFTLSPPQPVQNLRRHYEDPIADRIKLTWDRPMGLNATGGESNDKNVIYDIYGKSFNDGYNGNVSCDVDINSMSSCYPWLEDNNYLVGGLDEEVERGQFWLSSLNASTYTFTHGAVSFMGGWAQAALNASDVWYYKVYARNRGAFPSLVSKFSARVVGCPVMPIQSP